MINVGIIGCGHWGPNHVRVFSQLANSRATMCADMSEDRLKLIKNIAPSIQTTTNYKDILTNKEIDAVCIATPTNTHYAITKEALLASKHVLCEKPLALLPLECETLSKLAHEKNKILMVGHIFLFNPGITWLKEYIQSNQLGKIFYAYSTRTNLGPFRYDVNAVWDLAPHDISIFNYLFESLPVSVSAKGQKCLGSHLEDLAFATLIYPNNVLVNIHVSWLDPKKVRQLTLIGDKQMVVWDDLDNIGPIKLYDKHVEKTSVFYETYGEFQLLSREGSITMPSIGASEPLKTQAQYFLSCIESQTQPDKVNAQKGHDVVKVLCAIEKSMQDGVPVNL
jgi:predicted dehydrogenase